MKRTLISITAVILLLGVAIGSFVLGQKSQRKWFAAELDAAQAALWFNHLLQFRDIESNLTKGCPTEALEKTRISIDQEMRLLSEFINEHDDTSLNKYISDRDPALIGKLKNFKSKYGYSWTEPQCNK